jgi:serine protease Do
MFRFLSTSIVILFAPAFVTASELDTWQTKATDRAEPSIVAIKVNKSTGTGVIIDERGFIVTNKHVVGRASTVKVRMNNGKELTGEVIWGAAAYDLAVVQVHAGKPLPALSFAETKDIKRGHKVLAIGHPYGYEFSICDGIIASLHRSIAMPSGDTLENMIQTTAPINPGNSGGPLLNENGELIGINTALRDGAQNIAFAINASTVRDILNKNVNHLKLAGIQGSGAGSVVSVTGAPVTSTKTVTVADSN